MTALNDITALLDTTLRIAEVKDASVAVNGLQVENNGCVTRVALAVDGSQKTIDDAIAAGADLLVLLSDIDGLYTGDPHTDKSARLIPTVDELTEDILALGKGSASSLGTGGMATKLHAAEMCMRAGVDMIIANGDEPENLYSAADGTPVGTKFTGKRL